MAQNAPGKHFRQDMSLKQLFKVFPNNKKAEECSSRIAGLMALAVLTVMATTSRRMLRIQLCHFVATTAISSFRSRPILSCTVQKSVIKIGQSLFIW